MRIPRLVLLLLCLATTARAGEVTFKRVWPQWYDADSFQSFYEDKTGRELTGKWIVVRSQPEDRAGIYFLTRVENPDTAVKGATFTLRVIAPDSTETTTYNFPQDIPAGSHLFQIGLTGKDWNKPRVQPVAWQLELRSADGRILAQAKSFLWDKDRK